MASGPSRTGGAGSAPAAPSGSSLADPEALARLATLSLRAQVVVEGVLTGLHRSPHHGSSIEFAEHKEYVPGDDIRHMDWKVYGRADKYYLKRFEDETNLSALLVVDRSGSMGYGGEVRPVGRTGLLPVSRRRRLTKLEYASVLAATLAHLLARQQDAVGLLTFADRPDAFLPPRSTSGYMVTLLAALENAKPSARTDLANAVAFLAERARRRAMVLLFTDLWTRPEEALAALRRLGARKHDVACFHILDPDELDLPFQGMARFQSMEDETELVADPLAIRKEYLQGLEQHLEKVRTGCLEARIDYRLVNTSRPPADVLVEFLADRNRTRRGRR